MTGDARGVREARVGRGGGVGRAVLATLGLLLVAVVVFVLLGMVPADSDLGSVLRAAGGSLLAGLTLAWAGYLRRSLRRRG
ncbi:hypothetical protein [Kitasatospora brasiliensis]|uniref:hypothetical protein n=1 Tax=Kitasatospora brasiliensis TaxID=3058040 RepID=UPI00292F7A8A|nr:hypothetical protein [Kitasatospora sp. K002]